MTRALDALLAEAREHLRDLHPQFHGDFDTRLAEALLAVMPIVELACDWYEWSNSDDEGATRDALGALYEAVDATRTKETP